MSEDELRSFLGQMDEPTASHPRSENGDDCQLADTDESVLEGLVEQAKNDQKVVYEKKVIDALATKKQSDIGAYEALIADLKTVGVRPRSLEREVSRASLRVIDGGREPGEGAVKRAGQYIVKNGMMVWLKPIESGSIEVGLANFVPRIQREEIRDDGLESMLFFIVDGDLQGGIPLPTIEVPAERFAGMSWVVSEWGSRAVVFAGQANRDHLRCAMQLFAGEVPRQHLYTHIGWRSIDGEEVYLHVGGAIGAKGAIEGVRVAPPPSLDRYLLPDPPEGEQLQRAIRASLATLEIAPKTITITLLSAVYRATICASDASLMVTGFTGVGKSELAAIAQAHYGAGFDSRHLPESWSSTANALEGVAFAAKDALLVVDDFAPQAARYEAQQYETKADRVLRGQGNRSGRARMRPDGTLRPTKSPRGLILSTGEDLPSSQSIRARSIVLDVGPKDVDWDKLTHSQAAAHEGLLAESLAGFLRWLAPRRQEEIARLSQTVEGWREESFEHRRCGDTLGHLAAGFGAFLRFAAEAGAIDAATVDEYQEEADTVLLEVGKSQAAHQQSADPVHRFFELLSGALISGRCHVADRGSQGRPGKYASQWGWQGDNPQGSLIGWLDKDDLYLHPETVFAAVQMMAGAQGNSIGLTAPTLWRRIREREFLVTRQEGRNTCQREIGNRTVRVLHFRSDVMSRWETGVTGVPGVEVAETLGDAATAASDTTSDTSTRDGGGVETSAETPADGLLGLLDTTDTTNTTTEGMEPIWDEDIF